LSSFENLELENELEISEIGVFGMNLGCGYELTFAPMECTEHKFTYLISSVFAEVTSEVTDQGIKVNLWPSIVIGTSVDLSSVQQQQPSSSGGSRTAFSGKTGKQIMRMRYRGQNRDSPVIGWISDVNGSPVMKAELDLYIDAPLSSIGVQGFRQIQLICALMR